MKKSTKIVLGGIGIAVAAYFAKKLFGEAKEEVKEEIKEEIKVLEEAGIKVEETKKEEKNDLPGDNFVENVLHTLIFRTSDVWDEEVLKVTDYENFHDNCLWGSIRVIQRDEETVSILVQIPPYLGNRGRNGNKTLTQYKEDILDCVNGFLSKNNVKGMKWMYRGYYEKYSTEVTDQGNEICFDTIEIPEEDCKKFSDHGYADGLARLVSHFYSNNMENLKKEKDLHSVNMFVEIQLPIARSSSDIFGVDVIKTISLLKSLMFDLNIMERGFDVNNDVFPEIIFFPVINNFDYYYHTEENDNGVITSYWASRLIRE